MSKVQETIQEMARLTMLSNKLNDIQLQNLQMFPLVFFEGINESTLDYDLSNNMGVDTEENQKELDIQYKFEASTKHLRVSYYLETLPGYEQTHKEKRFEALESSVRSLLWKDITVQVHINKELVFESKK